MAETRPTARALVAVLTLLPALSACLSIEQPPDDLASRELVARPAQFAAAGEIPAELRHQPVQNDWVATFDDDTLTSLVTEAIAHNPDLQGAAAALSEARARTTSARASLWPWLDGVGTARRARPLFLFPGNTAAASQYFANVEASWELDLWGRIRSASASAEATEQATRLDLAAARQSLAASVTDAWLLALQARATLAIDLELLAAEERTAAITRDKVEMGVGTQLEAELADANVALANASVTADRSAIEDLTRALEVLLGRYPAAELALADELPGFPGAVAVGVPSDLLVRRPDLVAADRRVAAAFHASQSARAARLPSVTLTGTLGAVFDPTTKIWSIGSNLLMPLFRGGQLDAEVEIADSQQRQALTAYVGTALDAFREVEGALANERFLSQRETELRGAVDRMRTASRVGEDRYRAGILSIVDLITIRRQDFQSRRELLQVRTSRLRQRIALHLALGGSFDADASTSAGSSDPNATPDDLETEQQNDD